MTEEKEDETLQRLPEPLRAIWLLVCMQFEVDLGGVPAYLGNSHGRHALLAAQVLRRIGASEMAAVLEEAVQIARSDEDEDLTDLFRDARNEGGWWGDKLEAYLQAEVTRLAAEQSGLG